MPFPIAAAIPIVAGLAAGGGAAAGGLGGLGKNTFRASNYGDTKNYDPNSFNYGGWAGGASEAANRYAGTSNGYGAQAQYATGQAYNALGAAYGDRNNAALARGDQQAALGLMRDRATGNAPSIAQMQAQRDMEMARAAQTSAAASARGPAAMALAQQNAAANMGATQQGISRDAQIAAAQERMAAEQAYMGGASGMRQQDYAGAQTATGMANTAAGMSGQFQNSQQAYTNAEMGVNNSQLTAQQNRQKMLAESHGAADAINSGINGNNSNREMQFLQMGIGGVMGGASMGMGAGGGKGGPKPKAAGGPIQAGEQYLMGEQGPELVLPFGPQGGGGPAMASPMAGLGTTRLGEGGGMDVMGSLAANSAFGTQYIGNPMARADGGPVAPNQPYLVGERGPELVVPNHGGTVIPAHQTRALLGGSGFGDAGVMPLMEEPGKQLHVSPEGRGLLVSEQPKADVLSGASFSGPVPQYGKGLRSAAAAPPPPVAARAAVPRKLSNDELALLGKQMLADIEAQRAAAENTGPATSAALARSGLMGGR